MMRQDPARSKLALLMDFENLVLGIENDIGNESCFSIDAIIRHLEEEHGPVIYRKAFADWGKPTFGKYARDLQHAGVEMQHVVRVGYNSKNAADMFLVIHAMDCMLTYPDIDVFVLVTGDADFLPLITKLRAAGKKTVVVGTQGAIAGTLMENCDEFMCYTPEGLLPVPRIRCNLTHFKRAVHDILDRAGGNMTLSRLSGMLLHEMPDALPEDSSPEDLVRFLRVFFPAVSISRKGRHFTVSLSAERQAAPAEENDLPQLSFADYMRATRGFIQDPDQRDAVIQDIFATLKARGDDGLTAGELRELVDPEGLIPDKDWFGTVFSMTCGGCIWEDPATANRPGAYRHMRLYRGAEDGEEFRTRYYTSLFYKAFSERPDITPDACSELLFPETAEEHRAFFEQVLERLRERRTAG